MSVRSDVELLRQVPLFAEVDPAHLQLLVFSAKRIEVAADRLLIKKGSVESAGHLVLSGKGEALQDENGEAIATIETGAFLGELSMVAKLPVSITVRAASNMRALVIGHDLFIRVCSEFPEAGARVLAALSQKLDTSLKDLKAVQRYFDTARSFGRS